MNLAYREFARIGMGKVPDAKTLARIAQAIGGEVIARTASAAGGDGASGRRNSRPQDARRYDGSGDQHSLPHRFETAGRWRARVDPDDEEDRERRQGKLKRQVRNRSAASTSV